MARIRNTKPEFYSHEELNDLQSKYPELNPMLVFSGLWTQCEYTGVFLWSPRKLKLSILPFVNYDLEKSLKLLEQHGFIKRFVKDGKEFGYVYKFTKYQAISGSERAAELKYPIPTEDDLSKIYENTNDNTMTELRQDHDNTMTADLGLRTKDIGQMTNDLGQKTFTDSDESAKPPEIKTSSSPQKSDKPPPNIKKPPLLDRDPENDYERIEKQWQLDYRDIFGELPVSPPWGAIRGRLKQLFRTVTADQILSALENAKTDQWLVDHGWSLKTILAGEQLSKLLHKPVKGYLAADGPEDWQNFGVED